VPIYLVMSENVGITGKIFLLTSPPSGFQKTDDAKTHHPPVIRIMQKRSRCNIALTALLR
jgi:hypothetical protein